MVNALPKVTVSEGRVGPRVYALDDCVILGEFSVGFVYERLNSDSVAIILLFKY